MRLLVTGGAGFIGSAFVRNVGKSDSNLHFSNVKVLDSLTYAGSRENIVDCIENDTIEFIQGDITDKTLVGDLLREVDVVVNFAAESHVDRSISDPTQFILTNILGTQILLDASHRNTAKLFLQVSTDEVYGSINHGSWDESCILEPNSPYAASKAAGDLLSLAYNKTFGLNTIVTRCCNNFGPFQHPEKVIPKFITAAFNNEPLLVYGDGHNRREWIFVEDHCEMIKKLIVGGTPGEIYNIPSGIELSNIELANAILSEIPDSKSEIRFVQDRLGHDSRYSLNSSKYEKIFESSIVRSFSEDLKTTIDWYKQNESFWRDKL